MRRDRREEILVQLEAILNTVVLNPPILKVKRNVDGLEGMDRPGIILLDADEIGTQRETSHRGLGLPPQIVVMSPQIFYLAGNLPENTTIGTHLNSAKMAIMDAIVHNQVLRDICGQNGYIRYGGAQTDMKTGSSIEGQIMLQPVLAYPFVSSELKE